MKAKKITKKVIDNYLKEQGVSDLTNDVIVIELLFNIETAERFKKELKTDLVLTEGKRKTLNPAMVGYCKCLTNINNLCSKLAMTVQDRKKLGLMTAKEEIDPIALEFKSFMEKVNN